MQQRKGLDLKHTGVHSPGLTLSRVQAPRLWWQVMSVLCSLHALDVFAHPANLRMQRDLRYPYQEPKKQNSMQKRKQGPKKNYANGFCSFKNRPSLTYY